jgi:endoglucanase
MYKNIIFTLIFVFFLCNIAIAREISNNYIPCGFGQNSILKTSWEYYKKTFISNDGRVIDHQKKSISTSEGQSYAMRRAVFMDDKACFDKIYDWTRYNLKRKDDNLFAWLWGNNGHGDYKILDKNTASDGDITAAASLLLAYKKWGKDRYLNDAKKIINDIWEKETVEIEGSRILVAGVNQKHIDNTKVEVNPSYFIPNSFRMFADVDKNHDWQKVVDSSYELLNRCVNQTKSGLPPDWFYMNKHTGEITFENGRSDFSYDAIRYFYKIYVDYKISNDQRAKPILSKVKIFIDQWKKDKQIYPNIKKNGELKNKDVPLGSIALLLAAINLYDSGIAREIYKQQIEKNYNKAGYWGDPMDYYGQNLVWFGLWVYLDEKNSRFYKY